MKNLCKTILLLLLMQLSFSTFADEQEDFYTHEDEEDNVPKQTGIIYYIKNTSIGLGGGIITVFTYFLVELALINILDNYKQGLLLTPSNDGDIIALYLLISIVSFIDFGFARFLTIWCSTFTAYTIGIISPSMLMASLLFIYKYKKIQEKKLALLFGVLSLLNTWLILCLMNPEMFNNFLHGENVEEKQAPHETNTFE